MTSHETMDDAIKAAVAAADSSAKGGAA